LYLSIDTVLKWLNWVREEAKTGIVVDFSMDVLSRDDLCGRSFEDLGMPLRGNAEFRFGSHVD
jgi:hypothetical protein